jgi:hypothetical protein
MSDEWQSEFEIDENDPETYTKLFNRWFYKINWVEKNE